MCRQLPTAMVLGCVLRERSCKEVPHRKLASVSKALVRNGMLVNVSYPAVKKVESLYPEIEVVTGSNGFVVKKADSHGMLFKPDHIRIAYGGGLDKDEFDKIEKTVGKAVAVR